MIETGRLLPYLATVCALFLAPGPSVVFVVSRGVTFGLGGALSAVAGNTLGLATQLVVVLGPGLLGSATLFTVLKLAGALYLLWLGVSAIRHRRAFAAALRAGSAGSAAPWSLIRQGWVVGVTNPKGLITFTSIAPDFIHGSHGHTLALAALGGIGVIIALLCDGAWGLASGAVRRQVGQSSRRLELLNAGGGGLMIAFGLAFGAIALA